MRPFVLESTHSLIAAALISPAWTSAPYFCSMVCRNSGRSCTVPFRVQIEFAETTSPSSAARQEASQAFRSSSFAPRAYSISSSVRPPAPFAAMPRASRAEYGERIVVASGFAALRSRPSAKFAPPTAAV